MRTYSRLCVKDGTIEGNDPVIKHEVEKIKNEGQPRHYRANCNTEKKNGLAKTWFSKMYKDNRATAKALGSPSIMNWSNYWFIVKQSWLKQHKNIDKILIHHHSTL